MAELFAAIELELEAVGFRPEGRRFRPHITLGRVRSNSPANRRLAQLIHENSSFGNEIVVVDEVTVFASELESGGPVYTPLGHAPLSG
jgi:2'-5' RNA ligase